MKLDYLEYLDLVDALAIAIGKAKYYYAESAADEEERQNYEEKAKRYEELVRKLRHYAADNLY